MKRFFAFDAPLACFLRKLAYLVLLNLLFLASSIPIVTLGAAASAMYRVSFSGFEDNPFREYVRVFARVFRKATSVFFVYLLIGGLLYLDFSLARSMLTDFGTAVAACFFTLGFIATMTTVYVFPLVSLTDNTVKGYCMNAFRLAIGYLPRSVLATLLGLFPVGAILAFPYQTFRFGYLLVLFGFALVAQFQVRLLKPAFAPFLPEKPEEEQGEE